MQFHPVMGVLLTISLAGSIGPRHQLGTLLEIKYHGFMALICHNHLQGDILADPHIPDDLLETCQLLLCQFLLLHKRHWRDRTSHIVHLR